MATIGPRQVELKVHGLSEEEHGRVPGRLFANKLKNLVSALEAADALANGHGIHEYVLASMHMSQPTAILAEVPREAEDQGSSAIPVFDDAIEAIKTNDNRVKALAPVVKHVSLLAGGAERKFGFAEVRTAETKVVRIDEFLRKRAELAKLGPEGQWYDGVAHGSFDGALDYVDLRGELPQFKLTLTAGRKEVDCVCRRDLIDALRDSLHHRVRVSGRAFYSSSSPLPMRIEITSIEPVAAASPDFARWKGSFWPFAANSWDNDT